MRLRWLGWCARRGTEVFVHANNCRPTSWGPAWKWPSQAFPANVVCHAEEPTDHDQTSACRWLLGRRRWALIAPYPRSSSKLLHRWRSDNQSVTSRKHAQELLLILHRATAGCDEVGAAIRNQLHSSSKRAYWGSRPTKLSLRVDYSYMIVGGYSV